MSSNFEIKKGGERMMVVDGVFRRLISIVSMVSAATGVFFIAIGNSDSAMLALLMGFWLYYIWDNSVEKAT